MRFQRAAYDAQIIHCLVCMWQWYQAELVRPSLLRRAKRLYDMCMRQYDAAAAPMHAYLNVRAAGLVLHRGVWVDAQQGQLGGAGPMEGAGDAEATEEDTEEEAEERYAVLTHVLENLNAQLFIELMDSFPAATK